MDKIYLAPMAGITDIAFREICSNFGIKNFTSEMVSVYGLIYDNEKTKFLTVRSKKEKSFSVQLFGNEPKVFKNAAEILIKLPCKPDKIDINMGCPMSKITNNGAGCALMLKPELCGKIIKELTSSVDIPITVKIRAGWSNEEKNAPLIAEICEKNGASSITVHGRTRSQMYSGKSSLEIIKKVKNAVSIPVIGNGDVISRETYEQMLEYTGCDGVAIGRAAIGNPWIFDEINGFPEKSVTEKIRIVLEHFDKLCEYFGEFSAVRIFKKHLLRYFKTIFKTSKFNEKICKCEKKEDVLCLINFVLGEDYG